MYLEGFMNMVCILCMIWVWLGIYENEKSWMWFVVKCIVIVESDVYEKGFYIILNIEKAYFGNR